MQRLAALLVVLVLLAGCVGTGGPTARPTSPASPTPGPTLASPTATPIAIPTTTPAAGIELARSDIARAVVDPVRAAAAADAINAFSLELYAHLASQRGNIVISPASIAIALSMARAGAVGTTADQMDKVLHDLGSGALADAANALDAGLAARNGSFPDAGGEAHDVALRIANAVFTQRGMALQATYLDTMASRYGAGLWQLDFATDPEAARQAINRWVSERTEARIPEILKQGQVGPAMRLALANAIYLKAPWLNPFDVDQTAPGAFTLADGTTIQVPLMHLHAMVTYGVGRGWKAVELPYVGNGLAMTVIVPDDLAAFEAAFDAGSLRSLIGSLRATMLDVTMPSFDTESRVEVSSVLAALGMPAAFDPAVADFSGITTAERLHIGFVIHQANITVDEAGTEAAAATVVGFDTAGPGPDQAELRVDRPFVFVLRDVPTGAIVFIGRVANPAGS